MSAADEPRPEASETDSRSHRSPAVKAKVGGAEPEASEPTSRAHRSAAVKDPTAEVPPEAGAPPEYDDSMVHVLASKVLSDWLRNRQQLLVPFTLDLQKLDPAEAQTLMHAMIAAAHAGGDLGRQGAREARCRARAPQCERSAA